jgi:hypothetical protein
MEAKEGLFGVGVNGSTTTQVFDIGKLDIDIVEELDVSGI